MTDKKSDERTYNLVAVVAAHRAACEKRGSWRRLGDFEYDAIARTVLRQQREGAVDAEREALRMILKADQGDWDRTIPTLAQWAEARLSEIGGQ